MYGFKTAPRRGYEVQCSECEAKVFVPTEDSDALLTKLIKEGWRTRHNQMVCSKCARPKAAATRPPKPKKETTDNQ